MRTWAERLIERRLRAEWEEYRHSPEVKGRLFRRDSSQPRTQNFRSLVQVNFYRAPRG